MKEEIRFFLIWQSISRCSSKVVNQDLKVTEPATQTLAKPLPKAQRLQCGSFHANFKYVHYCDQNKTLGDTHYCIPFIALFGFLPISLVVGNVDRLSRILIFPSFILVEMNTAKFTDHNTHQYSTVNNSVDLMHWLTDETSTI